VSSLLVLGHVDADHVPLAAEERFGESEGALGLADAARADEQEHPHRLGGVVHSGPGGPDALTDGLESVILADHPLLQSFREGEHGLDLVRDHAPDRNPGPLGDHGGHGLRVDLGLDQRNVPLDPLELLPVSIEIRAQLRALLVRRGGGHRGVVPGGLFDDLCGGRRFAGIHHLASVRLLTAVPHLLLPPLETGPDVRHRLDELSFLLPPLLELAPPLPGIGEIGVDLLQTLRVIHPDGALSREDCLLVVEPLDMTP
jgi:hypothetical protein